MTSATSRISSEGISSTTNASIGEKSQEQNGELRRFGDSIIDGVTLHFDGTSMLVDQQVLKGCPVFSAALTSALECSKSKELTIEKYSRQTVAQMLLHLYEHDGDTFDQSNFYSKLSKELLPQTLFDVSLCAEVFSLADEYQLPTLRSKAQSNIMSIRRRAIQINDNFFAALIRDKVLSIYNKNWDLDMDMLDELAKQCLEHERVREWHTLGLFAKVEGVWVAQQEEYERLVKRLNVLDPGVTPIPMEENGNREEGGG